MDEKIPELEIEQSEVEPIDLPEGRRRAETGDQQSFGEDPTKVAPKEEEPEVPENDSGKSPRATKRRSHKEQQAELKRQRQQQHKMMQEMQKPVRHKDLFQIYQQINQYVVAPRFGQLQEAVDKLTLLPDYIAQCMRDYAVSPNPIALPSVEGFEDFYTDYLKKLEEEEAAKKAAEELKGSKTSPSNETTSEEVAAPETEETQGEQD